MASVEELLAKYGGTTEPAPQPAAEAPARPATGASTKLDLAPTPTPNTGTSTKLNMGTSGAGDAEPFPEAPVEPPLETNEEHNATNSDGRRLIADYLDDDTADESNDFTVPTENPFGPATMQPDTESTDDSYPTQVFYQVPEGNAATSTAGAEFEPAPEYDNTATHGGTVAYDNTTEYNQTPEYASTPQYDNTPGAEYNQAPEYASTPQYDNTPEYTLGAEYNQAPEYAPTILPTPAEPHAGLAALSAVIFPPFGAVAVHHATRTLTTAYNGNPTQSASHSSKTLAWAIAALIAGTLLITLIALYLHNPGIYDTIFNKIGILGNE